MLNISKGIAAVILLSVIHFYLYGSEYVKRIDYRLYDLTSMLVGKVTTVDDSSYSVIVDIDEKSIQKFGQWPWSRVIDAELINLIHKLSPSAIGVNIMFPEEDRLSPLIIQKFYQKFFDISFDLTPLPPKFQDNDKLLSQAIRNSNTTLPIYLHNGLYSLEHCEEIRYKENVFFKQETMLLANEVLCNHVSIQDKVENFGFLNAWEDSDGILRRVPLFMKYKEEVFPSLALATLLSFYDEVEVNRVEETVLVNFFVARPKIISASEILMGEVAKSDIQGKVVILGSSVIGTGTSYKTPMGKEVFESMIHAYVIDNILDNQLLIQPTYYKKINIIFSLVLSLTMIFFLSERNYLQAFFIFISVGSLSLLSMFIMYVNGVYISLGYFWTPFFSLFILWIIYHLRVLSKEKTEQDKFLIRQSKLATMGEMISLIAHQWRQPLSVINGTVLNMDMDYRNEKLNVKKFDNYLNDIEGITAYLSRTIEDFTDFFSKNKQAQPFKLSKIIEQSIHLSSLPLSNNIKIIYRNSMNIEVIGYASELLQSLLVLLTNASYACQKNLETIGEGKIFINVVKLDTSIVIVVEDNAGGVAKKDMKKIFDPYFTTKEKHNGTGLGLYILKLIVEDSMNGNVSLRNGKKGAIFSIEIPMNLE